LREPILTGHPRKITLTKSTRGTNPQAMTTLTRSATLGVSCACGAWVLFSLCDAGVKMLSDDFALHQIVLIRSAVALLVTLLILVPRNGGMASLKTSLPGLHLFRGLCIVFANLAFFCALASMNIADVTALFFIAPLLITVLSALFLKEQVGPRRWMAIGIGLLGIIIMIRPGNDAFSYIALLPLFSALAYATMQTTTRKIGTREPASTMSFYIQLVFLICCAGFGLAFGDGRYADPSNPTIDFLFRIWQWPDTTEWLTLIGIGIGSGFGAFLVNQAYRVTEANLVAPFEYLALPLAVMWSIIFWGVWPDLPSWIGMALILGSGLFVFFREILLSETRRGSSWRHQASELLKITGRK